MSFQEFKSRLLARKLELERQVAAIERDFAQGRSADFAEQATERENDEVLSAIEQKDRQELAQINRALGRMELGTYDKCAQCGEAIKLARLTTIPFTELCIRCAK